MVDPGVSVVICCYNSSTRIVKVLEHLALQQGSFAGEIILVDNCCTDDTVAKARQYWNREVRNMPLSVIQENQAGLTYARIAGTRAAQYETLVFCDDDNWLDKNYLQQAFTVMGNYPEVGIAGGEITAFYEKPIPEDFESMSAYLAISKPQADGIITKNSPFLPGAGLVVRRSTLIQIIDSGFQFFCSDRVGKSLSSGGDSELSMALVLAGYEVYFSNALRLQHFITAERISWAYMERLVSGINSALPILFFYYHVCRNEKFGVSELKQSIAERKQYIRNPRIWWAQLTSGKPRLRIAYAARKSYIKSAEALLSNTTLLEKLEAQIVKLQKLKRVE
jgi:glycosyltransferase involved in cell wall biosynthesis